MTRQHQKPFAPVSIGFHISVEAPDRTSSTSTDSKAIEPTEAQEQEELQPFSELVQTKLTIGSPGDKYELEADTMAAKVMAMPKIAIAPPEPDSRAVQASIRPKPIADLIAQRSAKRNTIASPNLESRLASTQGGGSPLPDDVRAFMEPRFGADFSSVRVHTDSSAVQMNQELGAKAFAVGNRIYYGAGKSPAKDELTAHELTHTIQQGAAQPKRISGQAKPNIQQKLTEATKHIGAKKLISRQTESPDAAKQNNTKSNQSQLEQTKEEIRRLLSSAGNLANLIANNPEAFLKNLSDGLKLGFNNFASNIRNHLQNALISWLTGTLGSIQMPPPNTPRVKAIFSLVLQVLGINGATIRSRAVAKYGAARVRAIENSVAIFRQVQSQPMEMWNTVQRIIRGEQTKIIDDIKNTVINVVIAKVVEKFILLLTPVAAIQALFKIYDILKFFIERCHQMMEFVKSVIDAVRAIAAGKVDGIASSVERALGRSLPVLIGTVAVTLGIESVATRIRNIISRMRAKVDSGIDYFLQEVGRLYRSVSQGNGNRRETPSRGQTTSRGQGNSRPDNRTERQKIADLEKAVADSENVMNEDSATPYSVNAKLPNIRSNYRLSSLRLHRVRGNIYFVRAIINPQKDSKQKPLVVFNRNEWKVGDLIQESRGDNWSSIPLRIIEIELQRDGTYQIKATQVRERVPKGQQPITSTLFSTTYGTRWRRGNLNTSYKTGEAWDRIRNLDNWSNFNDARQVLNYRYHNKFDNPSGLQWHHIIEQSVNGPNSVENLAITTSQINLAISDWFNRPQYGTRKKKVRDFVRNESRQVQRYWGEQAIEAMRLKIVEEDFGRGRFQQLEPK